MVRQQPRQQFGLVVLAAALPVALDFLQRDDVGAGDDLGDALEIIAAVGAKAVLDIVADEFHEGSAPAPSGISRQAAVAQQAGATGRASPATFASRLRNRLALRTEGG